ncbi:MAG: hypothetical protein KZQ93_20875 [Candidatus Thiodiazotropha sp. (ex Monitilora ramsayi)]|nr:hypothetical protein [Candidatus Thiodiazotropha sp. (ex Monitilora ramsayi)]
MKQRSAQTEHKQGGKMQPTVSKEDCVMPAAHKSASFTETYGAILTRELLISEFDENHSKYY